MYRLARFGLRFLVVVAIASMVPVLFHSPTVAPGPYVSALSNLAASQTFAASGCNFKGCAGGSRYNTVCAKVTTATNCMNYKGYCLPQNCP
jgi:hypothetical protein